MSICPRILEILKKHDVKATFFLEGRWVKENLRFAKMIVDAKQEVGNHSYTHPNMKTLSSDEIRDQLQKTNRIISKQLRIKGKMVCTAEWKFRDEVVKIADDFQMGTIMWTVDTIDWKRPEPGCTIAESNEKNTSRCYRINASYFVHNRSIRYNDYKIEGTRI
ncbi:polysaccharide deacetylase family protein [Bacillus pacificus]